MKEKEMWMQKLKEKLGDYTEPIPASGWERLEKELMPSVKKRIIPFHRRWTVAAAATFLVAASSVSLYFLSSPVADEIRHTSVPILATVPDVMPQPQEPASQVTKVEPVADRPSGLQRVARVDRGVRVLNMVSKKDAEGIYADPNPILNGKTVKDEKQRNEGRTEGESVPEKGNNVSETVDVSVKQPKQREVRKPSGKDKLHLPESLATVRKGGRWAMGASVGNAGAISINGRDNGGGGGQIMHSSQLDMSSATNGIVKIPDGQKVVFKDGVPYLLKTEDMMEIEHHQPVSFGLSLRKDLPKGFSVETGITYTLLSSDVKLGGSNVANEQKLHYMGIPLRANWNFLNKKLVTLYVSAGGAVEKCVYAELKGEKQTVKPLQFSLTGAVGAQINATKRLGVYVEPGVSYFFDDGSSMQTIRKKTPCNFNLQAGVRFTY